MNAKLLWGILAALIAALGFQLVSPSYRISVVEAQTMELTRQMETVNRTVRALGTKACFDSSPDQRVFLGLPCAQLLSGQ